MEITEVRVKLMEDLSERLQAFCSITFDDAFVIRDLKIIEGVNGPFVAMPSRKLTAHCPNCGGKNHLRAAYCNQCGGRLAADRALRDEEGRTKLYADIAHPINSACREMIQERVIQEFRNEHERAKLPGYVSRYEDIDIEDVTIQTHAPHAAAPPAPHHRPGSAPGAHEAASSREASSVRPGGAHQEPQPAEKAPRGPHRAPSAPAVAPASAAQPGDPRSSVASKPPSGGNPPSATQPPPGANQPSGAKQPPPGGSQPPAGASQPPAHGASAPPKQTGRSQGSFGAGIF